MDEDIPYRTAIEYSPAQQVSSADEREFSTLQEVRKILGAGITDLYKDFNAFETFKGVSPTVARADLLRQIEGRQIAYEILVPLLDMMDSTMLAINEKYKR